MAIGTPVERYAVRAVFNGTTQAISPATTIAAGTTALMFVQSAGVSVNGDQYVTGVTDSVGNTWTVDYTSHPAITGSGLNVIRGTIVTQVTSANTISITYAVSGNTNRSIWIQEVSGLAASPFDQSAANNGVGISVSSGATGTLTQADEIAFCLMTQTTTATWTKGASFTNVTTPQLTVPALEYKIVAATTAVTGDGTLSGASTWNASCVTYKADLGGGGTTYTKTGWGALGYLP